MISPSPIIRCSPSGLCLSFKIILYPILSIQGLVRRLEEKKSKLEKETEEIPFRGMEQDLSLGMEGDMSQKSPDSDQTQQSTGPESQTDEPGYWAGMNPEDSSDTDMNKSRFAVWPSREKGETSINSSPSKETGTALGSSDTVDKMTDIGRKLHSPNEVVLPGEDREGQISGAARGRMPEGASGVEEINTRVRKGDDGTQTEEWRIPSKMGDQNRQSVGKSPNEDLKGNEKSRQDRNL